MECSNESKNLAGCGCSYPGCPAKGALLRVFAVSFEKQELPACCFPADVERTSDRSFKRFAQIHK